MRRAPGLSFLLLSRGLPGSVADLVLAPIDETAVADEQEIGNGRDTVVTTERVQMSGFEVIRTLGEGAYAAVKLVKKRSTGEFFAMKRLIKQNYVQRRSAIERALPRRERDTLYLSGRHPNVAYLECAFDTDTYWVLVTEFCDLGSIKSRIRSHGEPGLAPESAANLSGQILQGLAHIHSFDIMHRDLKPDNVGISGPEDAPVAKLIDFGFAKRANAKQSRTIVGSHGYCAPEIDHARHIFGALGQSAEMYDERVDLYSYGITMMVMFIGREADFQNAIWTHNQFRQMLFEAESPMWNCRRYRQLDIHGDMALQELDEFGALDTIKALTETNPADRPRTARDAGRLPLFSRFEDCDCVPADWLAADREPLSSYSLHSQPEAEVELGGAQA